MFVAAEALDWLRSGFLLVFPTPSKSDPLFWEPTFAGAEVYKLVTPSATFAGPKYRHIFRHIETHLLQAATPSEFPRQTPEIPESHQH